MSEIIAQYQAVGSIVPLSNTVPAGPPQFVEPPLSPRTRALVVGLRRALLLVCDVLGEYAGIEKGR